MKTSFFVLSILVLFLVIKRNDLIDSSQTPFFPKDTYKLIHDFSSFQLGAWDNVVVPNESNALKLCQELRQNKYILKVLCEPGLNDFSTLVKSWLDDQFINYKAPSKNEFENVSDGELAKLSLLMGPEGQSILDFIRRDPLNHKEALLDKVKTQMSTNFEWKNGLLKHKTSEAILIPIRFGFKPEEIEKTVEVEKILSKYGAVMVGAYKGHLSNQGTIVADLNKVGIVGTLFTLFLLCILAYFRLFKIAKLIIPNALGVCVSLFITWIVFGKVHAITVTFGTGILGLAVDYGLHAIFLEDKKRVWRTNLYGFLTTIVVFIVFIFSEIPLIKQMMFFSMVALTVSYVFTYFLMGSDNILVTKIIIFPKKKWHLLSLIIALIGFVFWMNFKIDTSIKRFNYSTKDVEKVQSWFYSQMKDEKIFFKIYANSDSEKIEADYQSALGAGIRTESIFSFIPLIKEQKENLKSWIKLRDADFKTTEDKEKIFKPFFDKLFNLKSSDLIRLDDPPEYIQHLIQGDKILNIWFIKNDLEEAKFSRQIQGAENLINIFNNFTQRMTREILRFIPITFIAIFLLLYFKYREATKSFICLIPFLFAVGLYGIFYKFFNFPMSFMTLLGLLLICGVSVDYGIFSTDLFSDMKKNNMTESSFNFGLVLAWLATFLGFAPFLLCEHPILKDLGLVLVVGMIGVFYGTFFVIPAIFLNGENK